jgi:3-hydroxybutyrate dehydrogenase
MRAQHWGRNVKIASIHALVSSTYKSAYVSSKHGLIVLTRTTALEGGEWGITVNAICPAYVATPLVENQIDAHAMSNNLSREEVIEKVMLAPAAIKRLIQPSEIADLVLYLCSASGGAITGASLMIDLGWTAR